MVESLGFLDRLIVLMKLFEAIEVKQLAVGLSDQFKCSLGPRRPFETLRRSLKRLLIVCLLR
jgi:hypothetical protein